MNAKFHVSAKAVLIRERRILLAEYQDRARGETGFHYNFPGGRLRPNERLPDGVRRKVIEETGAVADVGPLLLVYEYIGVNHNCALGDKHSVSLLFRCSLAADSPEPSLKLATAPDAIQTGVKWIPLSDLHSIVLWPNIATQLIYGLEELHGLENLYIGDIE